MKLKDDTNAWDSLYHLSLRWARADSANFPYADYVQFLNVATKKIAAVIMRHDETWKWEDSNELQPSVATRDLVAGQHSYPISVAWLKIRRIDIQDESGHWHELKASRVRPSVLTGSFPQHYSLVGNSIILHSSPTYSRADALRISYQTTPYTFDPTDANDEKRTVGFSHIQEELAALMPALDYLDINGPEEQAVKVRNKIGTEPRGGAEGAGLLNDLALSYKDRNDAPDQIRMRTKRTSANTLLS